MRRFLQEREAVRTRQRNEAAENAPAEQRFEKLPSHWGKEEVDHFLKLLDEQEAKLVAAGFPPMSKWWRREIERFFRSGCRRWVLRVGRRGGKSSTIIRVLVCFVLSGMWEIAPGDVAIVAIVSVRKPEAAKRLVTVEAVLKALGVRCNKHGEQVDLQNGLRCEFHANAATIGASVGGTSLAIFGDEMAHWESRETGANPAKDVMGALRPSAASQKLSFEIDASAPWGTLDYHAKLFDDGNVPGEQVVSYAPTWVANDNFITEEETRALEPDPGEWARAYKAEPGATVGKALDPVQVRAAFGKVPKGRDGPLGWVACDPSEGAEDGFAWAAGTVTSDAEVVMREGEEWAKGELPSTDGIAAHLKGRSLAWRATAVWGDHYEYKPLFDAHAKLGVLYEKFDWTQESKADAFGTLRKWLREGKLCVLSDQPQLMREMLECQVEKLPSGKRRYHTSGLDRLACLVTLAHAVNEARYRVDGQSSIDWQMFEEMQKAAPGVFPG